MVVVVICLAVGLERVPTVGAFLAVGLERVPTVGAFLLPKTIFLAERDIPKQEGG